MSGLSTYLALQDRDRVPYTPSEQSIVLVRVIVVESGFPDPTQHQVNGAWISLGARECTVGEVAEHHMARTAAGPEQPALF